MQLRHAVDGVTANARQMGHAHVALTMLADQREPRQPRFVAIETDAHLVQEARVDLVDDFQVARQDALEQRQRPLLQRLRQQGVVGVGEGAAGDVPGFVPGQAMVVDQQPHQLGNAHRRVGVVQLYRELLVEARDRQALGGEQAQHVLQRAGHEEVLLLQPQLLALLGFVIGVEHLGKVLRRHFLVHRAQVIAPVEGVEVERLGGLRAPQPQRVDRVDPVAEDRRVERHPHHRLGRHPAHAVAAPVVGVVLGMPAEAHLHRPFGALNLPRIAVAQPGVGALHLHAVDDALVKDAVLVADAVAQRRNLQRGQRIHEAGRQPAQAAVAEAGFLLLREDVVEVQVERGHGAAHRLHDAEVDEVVAQVRPHQEFGGQVGHRARWLALVGLGRADPALHQAVAHGVGQRLVEVVAAGVAGQLALGVEHVIEKGAPDGGAGHRRPGVVRRLGGRGGTRGCWPQPGCFVHHLAPERLKKQAGMETAALSWVSTRGCPTLGCSTHFLRRRGPQHVEPYSA
ncbi:hypothetical protein D3C81_1051080 [compost metagenome]